MHEFGARSGLLTGDLVVGDLAQYLGDLGLRIDTAQLGASDQGV